MKDAFEKYDKISKATFDALERIDLKKTVADAPSFHEGVVQIMDKAGMPHDYMTRLKGDSVGTEDWLATFQEMAQDAGDWAADTALAGVMGAMGLEAWIPAAENVLGKFRTNWRDAQQEAFKKKIGMLQPGQWVYINEGKKPMPGWKDELRRRRLLIPESMEESPQDRVVVGFYLGPANRKGAVQVFTFALFRDQQVELDDIAPCGPAKSSELDGNSMMAAIRDLKVFQQEAPAQMDSPVPTDPGTEVVFEDVLYHIVQCEGGTALIEDEHGQRLTVSLDKLQMGRVNHTNSWNYREGEEINMGFKADGGARIYRGQWVWVRARDTLLSAGVTSHELGVVWKLQRDGIYVFRAIDGSQVIADEVWPLGFELNELLNAKKSAARFKNAAVTGGDTETQSMGQDDLLICIGRTNDAATKFPTALTPGERIVPLPVHVEPSVGDGGLKEEMDLIEDTAAGARIAPGKVVRANAFPVEDEDVSSGGGDSLFGYGVMAAIGFFIWNSVDVNLNILGA